MGTFNANILPATSGLSLGNQNQKWLLNGQTPTAPGVTNVVFSATPLFVSAAVMPIFTITLTGNVTSSTLSLSVPQGFIIFQITQDAIGGRLFTWPANFKQPAIIGGVANQVTTQFFYYDGTSVWPLASAVTTP